MNPAGHSAAHHNIAAPRFRTSRLRGLNTAWLEEGSARHPLVLFLHGYPDSPRVWDAQAQFLKSDFEVVRPYARGLLETDKAISPDRYRLEAQLLDLLEILNEKQGVNRRPVYLVGHDLGGVLALHLAPLLGKDLAGVTILNSLSLPQMLKRFRTREQLLCSWYVFAFQIPWLPERLIALKPEWITQEKKAVGESEELSAGQLSRPLHTYRAFIRHGLTHLADKPPRIHCPLLVLWGKRDPFLVTPTWEEWEEVSPDLTFRILDAGHWLQRERAGEVNQFLKVFLSSGLGGQHAMEATRL